MALVQLKDVTLWYPTYSPQMRALKSVMLTRLGGNISEQDNSVVVQSLDNLNLKLTDGDRLGIIGHNGAGKTTLLRVVSQIYEPQQGEVTIEGSVSSFVDITLGMDPESTGWDNIIFRGVFLGLTYEQARALAPSIAEFSELGDYLSMPVHTYSAGMFMRLAFAITTSVQPEIIVMDEMIGAGDARFLNKAVERIDGILDQTKIVIVATHSDFIMSRFCNKAMWMEKGRIKAFGPVEDILEQYKADTEQSDA